MVKPDDYNSLAQEILKRRHGDISSNFPTLSIDDGYRLQDAVHKIQEQTHGWSGKGYKIGATNAPARKALALEEPFYGRLYKNLSFASPAKLSLNEALSGKIEAEVAIKIGHDLKGENGLYDADSIRKFCIAMLPAIEITGSTFKMGDPPCPGHLIADFAGHAYWVFGEEIDNFNAIDPMKISVSVSVDGASLETGTGPAVDGGAFGATAFLANALNKRGLYIKAGDYISTGTLIKPIPCHPGQKIKADFGHFGVVEVNV